MSTLKQIALALLMIGSLSSAASAQLVVETYTATETYTFTLPGTSDGAGGLDFNYTQTFTTINFTPGDVTFLGQPVDFDGTEASYPFTSLTGTINIPVTSGPATVTATGSATASGPALSGSGIPIELIALSLGGSFSSNNLDVVLSSGGTYVTGDDLGNLSAIEIPELNGSVISLQGTYTVTTVNPGAGTFTVTTSGSILASPITIPTLSPAGLLVFAASLLGFIGYFRRRF